MELQLLQNPFVALVYSSIFLLAIVSAATTEDGFLSIDCGYIEGQYMDPQTTLIWKDDTYTQTGSNGNISLSIPSYPGKYKALNYKALSTFRYFPAGLKKYCYELPTPYENTSFLIRAMFLHGNSHILDQRLRFQVYINATLWLQVQYGFGNEYDLNWTEPAIREGMFLNHGGKQINVCFVPDTGTPFISSLELRKLESQGGIYSDAFVDSSRWGRQDFLLSNKIRWNVGHDNTSLVRYPNDTYDRFWRSSDDLHNLLSAATGILGSDFEDWHINRSALRISSKELNSLPYAVMESGWSIRGELDVFLYNSQLLLPTDTLAYLIFYVYSNESTLRSLPVPLSVTLHGNTQTFNITDQMSSKNIPYAISEYLTDIEFRCPSNRTLDLVAMEVYRQDRFSTATTADWDKEVAQFLRRTFNKLDWQGDPCTPEPYDGITCLFDGENSYLKTLALSHLKNSSSLMMAPSSDSSGVLLFNLSITNSRLDDNIVFYFLNNVAHPPGLQFLNLSHNDIRDFFNMTSLLGLFYTLRVLDLSDNHLTKVPSDKELDVLFAASIWGTGRVAWLSLDISNNDITGDFQRGSLQFLKSTAFKYLYANNNTISGKLDLTPWYQRLLAIFQNFTKLNESDSDPIFHQLFSFANNNIVGIIPDVERFESTINTSLFVSLFTKFGGGILLGGNPFCPFESRRTIFHTFLCRTSLHNDSGAYPQHKTNIPIIVGVTVPGGVVMLTGGLVMSLIIWRLRKQVFILREFQQELSNRNVKPPFFSYHELKVATEDFHIGNSLGTGGFGAVYKGILQNKSEVAVKKLFNGSSQASQVLSDFLNEVVLLTGIKHKNLVQLLGCCINDNERILVYEYAERGNVANALWGVVNSDILSWEERLKICLGTAQGLAYLHEELQPRIIHRDIKAANVLIDKNFNPKIADFGLAIPLQDDETRAHFSLFAGTKGYFAPEYALDGVLTEKADVYSFGILVLEIVSGRKCIDLNRSPEKVSLKSWAEMLQKQGNTLELLQLELQEGCPHKEVIRVIEIALLCVEMEPKVRPTMSQVVMMLSGITEDALFLSLSAKRYSFDKMALHFGAESKGQQSTSNEWLSLIPWQGVQSGNEEYTVDSNEDEALVPSRRPKSSFSIASCDASASTKSGTVMASFHKSITAITRSLRGH